VHFVVEGKPVGKGRPRITRRGTYTPAATVAWERQIGYAARVAMAGAAPFEGPVGIAVTAVLKLPKKYREDAKPITGVDADNILKAAMDALNRIVYRDDAQVVTATVGKVYGLTPRLIVDVEAHGI
jgi:Holliday junction resolvase RusA-like endonuclease